MILLSPLMILVGLLFVVGALPTLFAKDEPTGIGCLLLACGILMVVGGVKTM